MRNILLVFILSFLSSCISSVDYTIRETVPSPNGEYVAIAFLDNGDSLTSYRPQVSIIRRDEKFCYTNGKVFSGYRAKYIDIFWKNNDTLIIKHNCLDEYIFKKLEVFNGIKIEYIVATREDIAPEDIEAGDYIRRKYYSEN
jgi:hypothetical protein